MADALARPDHPQTLGDDWLVIIDPQVVFADPQASPWGSSMWAGAVGHIATLAAASTPSRTMITRFVADPGLGGSWGPYYEEWPFALVPDGDPLYAVVPELAGVAEHVVTAGTFGKWPVLRDLVGDGARLTRRGGPSVSGVPRRALRAAHAGAPVRIAAAGCAGSSEENHRRALDAMALYGPQITIID